MSWAYCAPHKKDSAYTTTQPTIKGELFIECSENTVFHVWHTASHFCHVYEVLSVFTLHLLIFDMGNLVI